MALSQIQCLDENHVNPRTHESKPDFFYCEDQRLALEVLLKDGREAFSEYLKSRGQRGFLSDLELETFRGTAEPFDPGSELLSEAFEGDQTPLSLHYWPDISDASVPQLDLGWPHSDSYRGVTRTSVYTQPPLDGQAHIKEVVRKMIVQAQKVIAVVMDIFTDVDIFRDLLDAGFKRKVSVYILLERTGVPHFLSMCHRANMHAGHLKHLRVRCSQGTEFHTRFCTKVRGRMGHRFMFIDGDKAVSGSYSFTWMSSRMDRNLVTVTTGQAVDAFDQLFRFLYMTSSFVDLQRVALEPEPEPDLRPQIFNVARPPSDVARKLINPKYALLGLINSSPTSSIGRDCQKEPETVAESKKMRQMKVREEVEQNALHPGLVNLEKACLMTYLPTWPEPDPPSDVIGFINIRDANRPTQVHLQRSEMFETSQAIRFSSPISRPQETTPEVAKPRQQTTKLVEEDNKKQQEQSKSEAEDLLKDKANPVKYNSLNDSKTHLVPQSNSKALTPTLITQSVSTNSPESDSICKKDVMLAGMNIKSSTENRAHPVESIRSQISRQPDLGDSNSGNSSEQILMSHGDSHRKAVNMQPAAFSEVTHIHKAPNIHSHVSTASAMQPDGSTVLSKNSLITTVRSSRETSSSTLVPSTSSQSVFPSPVTPVTTSNSPLPSPTKSTLMTSSPPVPKLRTVHLVYKDSSISNNKTLPDICLVRSPNTNSVSETVFREAVVTTTMPASPLKEAETDTELQSNKASKTGDQINARKTHNTKDISRQKLTLTAQKSKDEEANIPHNSRAWAQTVSGTKLQIKTQKPSKDTDFKTETDLSAISQSSIEASEKNLNTNSQTLLGKSLGPQADLCSKRNIEEAMNPSGTSVQHRSQKTNKFIDGVDESVQMSVADKLSQLGKQKQFISMHTTNSILDSSTQNTKIQEPTHESTCAPKKSLRLQISLPNMSDVSLAPTERQLPSPKAAVQTTTPDEFSQSSPTPDSQTTTPDSRCFLTPTSDISDGYISPREDSTTSEEYFECSEYPLYEPNIDLYGYQNHGAKENCITFTNSVSKTTGSFAHSKNMVTSSDSTNQEILSCTSTLSFSSLIDTERQNKQKEDTSEYIVGEKWTKEEKVSHPKKQTFCESQETGFTGTDEADQMVKALKQEGCLTETAVKISGIQVLRRKNIHNQSAVSRLFDGREFAGDSTFLEKEFKQDFKSKSVSSERGRPDKTPSGREKIQNQAALEPGIVEMTESQTSRDAKEHKQQDVGSFTPSQSLRSLRPLSASQLLEAQPSESHELSPTKSKLPLSRLKSLDSAISHHKSTSRQSCQATVGVVESSAGRKQISRSPQTPPSQQPQAAQIKSKASQALYPKPQPSFLHTYSNLQPQDHPHPSSKMESTEEAHGQEKGKASFNLSFSRLYSFKSTKDKISKMAQSKKEGVGPPVRGRKSSS